MTPAATLLAGYDGLLLDLDGVVYVGAEAVPRAVPSLRAAGAGAAIAYVTNNASRPASEVARHLRELGLELTDDQVVTSAQVAATMVARRCGEGARVLPVGGPGVAESLRAAGLVPVGSADAGPEAVVQGFGPLVSWTDLAEAVHAVRAGAWWVATNLDRSIPTTRGIAPGNGALVQVVRTAVDVEPAVAGKPGPVAFRESALTIGSSRPLVVGDRIDTDIEGAVAAGMDSLLVLTGVHGLGDLVHLTPRSRPTFVAGDLDGLHRPPLRAQVDGDLVRCGDDVARLERDVVETGPVRDAVAAAWAGLTLLWARADAGAPVRAGDALEELLGRRRAHSDGDR